MKNYSKKELQSMSDWELVQVYCDEIGGIDENDLMIEVRGNKQEKENLISHLLQRMKPKYAKGSTVKGGFKLGDKVIISYINDGNEHNGEIGTITYLNEYNYYPKGDMSVVERKTQGEITYHNGEIEEVSDFYREGSGLVSPIEKVILRKAKEYVNTDLMEKLKKEWQEKNKPKYAKGSTVKGKDFSGNYYSTNDFVGAHNLQKQAEKIFGKGWEAEDDVNQIENIINSIGGKYVVTVPEDRSQWNEMREQYDLANPTNDSNYDIFVISESDFKYAKGSTVKGKGGASFFDIYDEESGKTLLVKAYSLEQAEGISETIDFDDYENGQEVDMLDDIANYEAEEYAKGSTLKNANSDSEKFELKVLQALSGYNNGREENGIMEGLGLSNYRFNQYASKQEVAKVEKTLKALIKNKYIEEGGIGYKITKIGANHLRSFNYGSYGNGGGVAVSSESGLAFGTNAELLMNEQNLQYADGGAVGMYSIRVWESEDDRDMGESFIIEKVSDKYEAKEKAKKMYQKNDLAAVEVEDENGDTLLHLSSDGIEEYAKGGNMSIGFNYEIGGL